MDIMQSVELEKVIIMKELFAEINEKNCVIDLCIKDYRENNMELSEASKDFFITRKYSDLLKAQEFCWLCVR